MNSDLFTTLSRYATRQEENYLTESLVLVLNSLLANSEIQGKEIVQSLCGPRIDLKSSEPSKISISTQLTTDEGRPDIVVKVGDDKVIFIEVKHDSQLGQKQLERYFEALEKSPVLEKQLVLLTRSRNAIQETELEQERFHHVCWYEIAGWMSDLDFEDEVSAYLVNEFLGFLQEKNMSIEKVSWEYIKGVEAMESLISMLGTAIAEAMPEEKTRHTAGWDWKGHYFGDELDIWVGVRYRDPLAVEFQNNKGEEPSFSRDLSLPDAHFFSLNAGEQLECLIEFINRSIEEFGRN